MEEDNEIDEQFQVDKKRIQNAIRYQLPIEVTTYTLPRNMEYYIREILHTFLDECHQEQMFEYLNFCNGELLTNAKKANTKRVYFKEKGLDIENPDDYEVGMLTFKEDTLTNIDHYLELQKKEGLYIKLALQLKGEQIKVEIRNNSVLLPKEKERIQNKIDSVQQYNSMEDVFTKVLDQSEGAGLGIIIIILMLQKIGLSRENYQVISTDTETITRIVLPCNETIFAGNEILTYEYIKMQDLLPVRKSTYDSILKIVGEETIDKAVLFDLIKSDASLYVLALQQGFNSGLKNVELTEIIDSLTDEQIKNFYTANKDDIRFIEDEEKVADWEHAKYVAHFAYNLVNNYSEIQTLMNAEQAYSVGLLNCIGNILLRNPTKEQEDYVDELCQQYEEPQKIKDVFFSGNGASYLAMIYAKKIGLPDIYSAVLGCWNNLNFAIDDIRNASKIIYLAEMFQLYDENVADFYQFDKSILEAIKVTNEDQFITVLEKLKSTL